MKVAGCHGAHKCFAEGRMHSDSPLSTLYSVTPSTDDARLLPGARMRHADAADCKCEPGANQEHKRDPGADQEQIWAPRVAKRNYR